MAVTYKKIASVTVGSGGAADIEFTSIPASFTDIEILISMRVDAAAIFRDVSVTTNNNNSSNGKVLYALNASTISSYSPSPAQSFFALSNGANSTANSFSSCRVYFPNYSGSTAKSLSSDSVIETNGTDYAMTLSAGLYSSTAAITSVKFTPFSGSFVQYTTATLYGISNS